MELLFLNTTEGSEFMFPVLRLQNFLRLRENFPHVIKKFLRDSCFILCWVRRLEHGVLILVKYSCVVLTVLHFKVYVHRTRYVLCWCQAPDFKGGELSLHVFWQLF